MPPEEDAPHVLYVFYMSLRLYWSGILEYFCYHVLCYFIARLLKIKDFAENVTDQTVHQLFPMPLAVTF